MYSFYLVWVFYCFKVCLYLYQVVKDSRIEGFGQGVSCVGGLLLVQCHIDGLRLPSPLWIHFPAGQLVLQTFGVDAQQIGWEGEHWSKDKILHLKSLQLWDGKKTATLDLNTNYLTVKQPQNKQGSTGLHRINLLCVYQGTASVRVCSHPLRSVQ